MKSPKYISTLFITILFAFVGVHNSAVAETKVSAEQLKTLLSGNSTEGKNIKWKTTHKMYFDADGKISRIDNLNNKETGNWFINESGDLCIKVRKKRCNQVMKRDDGGYNVYRRGDLKFTFDKIVNGNPYNL